VARGNDIAIDPLPWGRLAFPHCGSEIAKTVPAAANNLGSGRVKQALAFSRLAPIECPANRQLVDPHRRLLMKF
jgi:hypothetical protein